GVVARTYARAGGCIKGRHNAALMCASADQREKLVPRSAIDQHRVECARGAALREWVQGQPHRALLVLERGKIAQLDLKYSAGGCGRRAVSQDRSEPLLSKDG